MSAPVADRQRLRDRIDPLAAADETLDRFIAWIAATGITPYAAQEEALLELWSGKSLVALGLHYEALCEGRRSFYAAPIKALASEKFFALCDELSAENVGMLTGDASINWNAPVICCTAEVLMNIDPLPHWSARSEPARPAAQPARVSASSLPTWIARL